MVLDRPREDLRGRIERRTQAMLAAGWLEETAGLLAAHAADSPGLLTLGYRELAAHLLGEMSLETALESILLRTGRYAKRQQTWFRPLPRAAAGEPGDPPLRAAVRELLARACGES